MTEVTDIAEVEIISPEQYGLEVAKANELVGNLPQITSERDYLVTQYDIVVNLDIEAIQTAKDAKKLRLLISKNRTQGINKWHKTTKDFFLRGGQFIDAIKRKEVAVNERMEEMLMEIEKYQENLEIERITKLSFDRLNEIKPFLHPESEEPCDLGRMADDVWSNYLLGAQASYNARIQAIADAEKARIEYEEKAEQESMAELAEQARVRKENEQLRVESVRRDKIEQEAEAERKRLVDELQVKADAERQALETERVRLQAELTKDDSAKINDLIVDLNSLKSKYTFKSEQSNKMYAEVSVLLGKIINHIEGVI